MNDLAKTLGRLASTIANAYRYTKIVMCPNFNQPAEILIERTPGAPLKAKKKAVSVKNCSLWPKRKRCNQSCVR
jgi:ribosomal protein L13